MEFIAKNVIWLGLAVGSGFLLLWPLLKKSSGGVVDLSPGESVLLINRENALVLDVRDDAEFAAGHVTGAKHIPLAKLPERLKELAKYREKPILVNCQGGIRSAKACDILKKNEFSKIYNLRGGLKAWIEAKLPTVKA
ncbi:sulfurtransferase [Methylovorus sp. MM2]|uniref:rhodanese-like domain-containing protein n=1 Tax=Methylovorus sp. MM2 TaxID=1848038 RepID=UPI0007E0FC77|nr:rhodanese-like domain-containing protein [Methylovorus sp. MM2]OAM51437.1 sulfurtransferase [Methylovorus sp. MM2]